jgi:hypothetical protein
LAYANLGNVYRLMGYSQKAKHCLYEAQKRLEQVKHEMPEKFYDDWLVTTAALLYEMGNKERYFIEIAKS